MKLGILGAGMIVREFLPWLVESSPFEVEALCSTERSAAQAAQLCEQYHIPCHTTNYLELLQRVDVVYIAVPNIHHTRYAKVSLPAALPPEQLLEPSPGLPEAVRQELAAASA